MYKDLYFSPEEKRYYFIGLESCVVCKHLIDGICFIKKSYDLQKSNKKIEFFCVHCVHKGNKRPVLYTEIFNCLTTEKLPKDAYVVIDGPPNLDYIKKDSGFIEAGNKKKDLKEGTRVIDKTIQCHNPTFMIQSDSKTPTLELPNGTRLMDVETLNVPIPEEKLSKKQLVAIKKLEVALINKERLVSETELDNLLNDYKNAEPLIEGPSNKKLGVRLTKNDEKEINLSS